MTAVKPAGFLAFFVFGLVFLNQIFVYQAVKSADYGILGGPVVSTTLVDDCFLNTAILSESVLAPSGSISETTKVIPSSDGALLGNLGVSSGVTVVNSIGVKSYIVEKGDTLKRIAAKFHISEETLVLANGLSVKKVKPGQELIVLPVSGVLHEVLPGETAESLAKAYNISIDKIRSFNKNFIAGEMVIIPGAKKSIARVSKFSSLPDLGNYFSLPVKGFNWGKLHDYNAVDIVASCGSSIIASAPGVVSEIGEPSEYNDGYGGYILVEHTNNAKTRYAHTEKNLVSVGDIVKKGEKIALVGSTGNVHGPTGCHLHFEVLGAKNPFVK